MGKVMKMESKKFEPSSSRQYVAMCYKSNFEGMYFRKFRLPENQENTVDVASWYFLNKLNYFACILGIVTLEDFLNLKDQEDVNDACFA